MDARLGLGTELLREAKEIFYRECVIRKGRQESRDPGFGAFALLPATAAFFDNIFS